MKNWDHGNCPSFDENPTECFIEDIEKIVQEQGWPVIMQAKNNLAQVLILTKIPSDLKLIPLPEALLVYWNEGAWLDADKLDYVTLHYQWEISLDGDILIWWDHDLGDVAIDRITPENNLGVVSPNNWSYDSDFDKITDHVYFYWVT